MRVLIVKPSSLGDVVSALAVVPRLRQLRPGCTVDWLVNREYAPLVAAAGVDHVIVFDRGSWRRWQGVLAGLRNLISVTRAVRRGAYDVVIDLQGLLRSGWFTLMSGAARRIGFADAREGAVLAYNKRVRVARGQMHAVECCLAALRALGDTQSGAAHWEWPGLEHAVRDAQAKTGLAPGRYVVLAPGTRRREKRWPAASWGALAGQLWQTYHLPVALVGAENERELAAQIAAEAGKNGAAPGVVHLLAGALSLLEVLGLSRASRLVIACDSGALHAAVAVGARVVALMGPTHPERHGPYGQPGHVVLAPEACAPCHGGQRVCGAAPRCMDAITVDMVMNKVHEVLQE